ncbi:hypothetical protein V8C35DRAFT_276984 [Trichoderma chlorosporum]
MSIIPLSKWDVEIHNIFFSALSLKTASVQVNVKTGSEIDLGWISAATVFFFYGHTLIGEATLEKTSINTEDSNEILVLELAPVEIQNTTAIRTFIRGIMPKALDVCQPKDEEFTGQLEIVEQGYKLTLSMDLQKIGSLKASKPSVYLTGTLIEISFSISNPTPLEFYFEKAEFKLMKNGAFLAKLFGDFDILLGENGDQYYVLKGEISSGRELFGLATLRGSTAEDYENTWFIHAIREFQIEVNLDKKIVH